MPQPRMGAPVGNANRLKSGLHTAEMKALRRRLRAFQRQAKTVLAKWG